MRDTFSQTPLTKDSGNVSLPSVISTSGETCSNNDIVVSTVLNPHIVDSKAPRNSLSPLPVITQCARADELSNNHNISGESTPYSILNELRVKNLHRVIFAHININSIRNKLDYASRPYY